MVEYCKIFLKGYDSLYQTFIIEFRNLIEVDNQIRMYKIMSKHWKGWYFLMLLAVASIDLIIKNSTYVKVLLIEQLSMHFEI